MAVVLHSQASAAYRWRILDLLQPTRGTKQQQQQQQSPQRRSNSSLKPSATATAAAAAAAAAHGPGVSLIPSALNCTFAEAVRSWCAQCPSATVHSKPCLHQQHSSLQLQHTLRPSRTRTSSSSSNSNSSSACDLSHPASKAPASAALAAVPAGVSPRQQQQQQQQRLFVLQPRPSWEGLQAHAAAGGPPGEAAAAAVSPEAQSVLLALQDTLSTRSFYKTM
jgi:hypothetical protein